MATQILNLPLLSVAIVVRNTEDWNDSLPGYVDSVGNPITLAGLELDFMMRTSAADVNAVVVAGTASSVRGLPLNGIVVVAGNVAGLSIPRAWMTTLVPGSYVAELQAIGDGLTKTIGIYPVTVIQGVVR